MSSLHWYTLTRKTLEKANLIVQTILKDPFLKQTQIAKLTNIPRPTVCRILNKLAQIGAIRKIALNIAENRAYKYEVNPKFVEFLSKNLSTDVDVHSGKPGGLSTDSSGFTDNNTRSNENSDETSSKLDRNEKNSLIQSKKYNRLGFITRPDDPKELEKWCKDGFFRVHGFQRKWVLRNYRLVDDEEKWRIFAILIEDAKDAKGARGVKDAKDAKVRKVGIGRRRGGVVYIVRVWNDRFKVHFSLQFRAKSLIVTLPREESIYIPWDEFNKDVEKELETEVKMIAERAVKVYKEVFGQQVLAYDDGWVGRKRALRPEVAYVDPDGIIRKVYEVEGATYIEGLGYWVDGSLRSTPEVEFESVETASKFKKAIEVLASGELDREINEVKEKMESLDRRVSELDASIQTLIAKGVEVGVREATQQLVSTMLCGTRPVQDQLNEMWKRISDMQETLNLMLMYQIAKESGDKDLAEAMKVKLMRKIDHKTV